MLDSKSHVSKTDRYIEREIDKELIFIAESGFEIHTISDTAFFIYRCIDDVTPVSTIIASVCDEYEIDSATAEKDVIDFLYELLEKEIIIESR
jgi:hypothetical protein